jgi:hypothetical protein
MHLDLFFSDGINGILEAKLVIQFYLIMFKVFIHLFCIISILPRGT